MDAAGRGRLRARRRAARATALALAAGTLVCVAGPAAAATNDDGALVSVIVEGSPGAASAAIDRLGGTVQQRLDLIDGLQATVPATRLAALSAVPGVRSVTADGTLVSLGELWGDDTTHQGLLSTLLFGSWRADGDKSSAYSITRQTGAQAVWDMADPNRRGVSLTGDGVGVALIDTGIAPVAGLSDAGKVVNGPDLSFDSQSAATTSVDGFGHGTHMAGLVAGHDTPLTSILLGSGLHDARNFNGMAPGATIVNVKAGASDGSVDVSQVIAAIDWVVENKASSNIRVINLSYGTASVQSTQLDPLAHAVENAWRAGIVVVVAAGNDGESGPQPLNMPAADPYVLAVGSADNNGSSSYGAWTQGAWTNSGDASRHPDLLAPGKSVVSLRDPGSAVDTAYPEGRVYGDNSGRYFRGSGTSMSAAVVSGAVALLLQADPSLTPDQVKGLLTSTGDTLGTASVPVATRELNVKRAVERAVSSTAVPAYTQSFAPSTGLGSLEAARGTSHLVDPATGTLLAGEQDVFGVAWDAPSWAAASSAGRAWAGGVWRGTQWTGNTWSSGTRWAAVSWVTPAWTGVAWLDREWARKSLAQDLLSPTRVTWRGTDDWTRLSWSGDDWHRLSWSAGHW